MLPWIILAALGGLLLVAFGVRGRRVGDRPHCRRCGYDVSESGAVCSECGAALPANAAAGEHRRRPGLIAAGGVALLLAAAAAATHFAEPARLPSGVLLWQSPSDPDARQELLARWQAGTLADRHRHALTEQAVRAHGHLMTDFGWWPTIEQAMRDGVLPDEQQDAMFDRLTPPKLLARPIVERGRQARIAIIQPAPGSAAGAGTWVVFGDLKWIELVVNGQRAPTTDQPAPVAIPGVGVIERHTVLPPAEGDAMSIVAVIEYVPGIRLMGGTIIQGEAERKQLNLTLAVYDYPTGGYTVQSSTAHEMRLRPIGWKNAAAGVQLTHTVAEVPSIVFFVPDDGSPPVRFAHTIGSRSFDVSRMTASHYLSPLQVKTPTTGTIVVRPDVAAIETQHSIQPTLGVEVRWEGVTLDPKSPETPLSPRVTETGDDRTLDEMGRRPTSVLPLSPGELERRNAADLAAGGSGD